MTDNIWSLIGVGVVAYLVYRHFSKQRPRLTVMQGGLSGQYSDAHAPSSTIGGGAAPPIAVVSWPGDGSCPC